MALAGTGLLGFFLGGGLGFVLRGHVRHLPVLGEMAAAVVGTDHRHVWAVMGKVEGRVRMECTVRMADGRRCPGHAWRDEVN